jgi:hypothetical protein
MGNVGHIDPNIRRSKVLRYLISFLLVLSIGYQGLLYGADHGCLPQPAEKTQVNPTVSPSAFLPLLASGLKPGSESAGPISPAISDYSLDVVPNPNNGRFRLDIEGEFPDSVNLTIIDATGKQVYKRAISESGELYLSLRSLRKGIYFAQLRIENVVISHPILYAYDE